jgi:hypothetical protein
VALLGGNVNWRNAVVAALVDVAARSFVRFYLSYGVSHITVVAYYIWFWFWCSFLIVSEVKEGVKCGENRTK